MNDLLPRLKQRAIQGIKHNIITSQGHRYLPAGPHQFRTLWTRDFCYSIPGLLQLGEDGLVHDQLTLYWQLIRQDGLLPRGVDVINPKMRVLANLIPHLGKITQTSLFDYQARPLRAEYLGEHGTPCIDSNLLVVEGSLRYLKTKQDREFQQLLETHIPLALNFYKKFQDQEGFIHQPPYSDWQDSLKRHRPTLLTHLLFRRLIKLSKSSPMAEIVEEHSPFSLPKLEEMILGTFLRDEKWKGEGLEALLWLLEDPLPGFTFTPQMLLEIHPLASMGTPNPSGTQETVSWTTRMVGLQGYHLELRWSWLMAEAARILGKFDHEYAYTILSQLDALSEAEGYIGEVYNQKKSFKALLYRSEIPFSWGSAKLVEAISALES